VASLEAAAAAAVAGLKGLVAAVAGLASLAVATRLGHSCRGLTLNWRLAALLEEQLLHTGCGGCLPSSSPPGSRGTSSLASSAGHRLELGLRLLCGSNN
jgi:hypothetical protein